MAQGLTAPPQRQEEKGFRLQLQEKRLVLQLKGTATRARATAGPESLSRWLCRVGRNTLL